jgi:hypothetical protein
MHLKMWLAAVAVVVTPAMVNAQTTPSDARGARIDKRQSLQQQRIDKGVQSGQLNARETARLERGQSRIQKMEDRARADGTITGKEARRINRAQNANSARIHRQKHDGQTSR